ncbi:MAG: ornithine cyclodeaminase family protein [Intrasporangium sp.]|uniref:ornithine cyclodeaminase family protein n=1 Tax=Intrasporangium sp. TaxID=1925024 RepID=UPI002647AE98|nr:ornithine cyclodeaminase family protein [Intrasporangium sp.]MDN5796038.1 ornithine cyclodeaminase family protein [Intrasporangium sp.]
MRVLTDADVGALAPDPVATIELVADALRARARGEGDVPPKHTVHAGPRDSFANGMSATWPERDLVGNKWITLFPTNSAQGLPTASGVLVLNDGQTGVPTHLIAAGEVTARRTAAVTGACLRSLAPAEGHVAYTGAGAQARSHLRVLEALGRRDVVVYARRAEARDQLAAWAAEQVPSVDLRVVGSPGDAVRGAGVVITGLSIGIEGAHLDPADVGADTLLLPIDYASSVGPGLAASALLASDDRDQFESSRLAGKLGPGYPAATAWDGDLLDCERPPGRIVCQNLGMALADLIVGDAVARAADAAEAGQVVDLRR